MEVINNEIEGLLVIKPRVFEDPRGYFFESYNKRVLEPFIGDINFVQDNESSSKRGVVRGLHFQAPPFSQAKLVRCVRGEVLDVAVDIRKDSKTFGKYFSVILSGENHLQFFIPKGFAHGFAVLSEEAVFQYKCDNYYHPESEGGIALDDPDLNIDWKINLEEATLSEKDRHHPLFKDFKSPF